jgi:5-methyltetrahydrofolate--homocysteine methyltransferase
MPSVSLPVDSPDPEPDASASIDQQIRARIMDPQGADIQTLVDQALETHTPDAVVSQMLLPGMRAAVDDHLAGHSILPDLLESAEVVRGGLDYLGPRAAFRRGSVMIATLPGDVHHVGKALLVSILSACGYRVHDLGNQVPIEAIVDTALRLQPDAIGLSALLVSTSRQMPACVQQLDARGVHIPVLVGGAAINRAFGRRSGVLRDGRVYEPGVFYCKDVFEGLATLDTLVDATRRAALVAQTREEVEAELHAVSVPPIRPSPRTSRTGPRHDIAVPVPPYWGSRKVTADLPDVWRGLDRNTLFRYHWGGYRVAAAEDFDRLVRDVYEPTLATLSEDARRNGGWLQPLIVSGYFACNADGDGLVIYASPESDVALGRLSFPRQSDGERLCLADYFRPAASGERDVVALQAVTTGPRAGEYIEELLRAGAYARMLYVSGLAAATAEALAGYAHNLVRHDLGLGSAQSVRFSWGYPACPDLAEQRMVLALLEAEAQIGLRLSQSNNLDPEHSTAAFIVHHPEAKYFAVRGAA